MKFSTLSDMLGASSAQLVLIYFDEVPAAWNHVKMQPGTLSMDQLNGIVKYCCLNSKINIKSVIRIISHKTSIATFEMKTYPF